MSAGVSKLYYARINPRTFDAQLRHTCASIYLRTGYHLVRLYSSGAACTIEIHPDESVTRVPLPREIDVAVLSV